MPRASKGKRIKPNSRRDAKHRLKHSCGLARRINRSKAKVGRFRRALELQIAEDLEQRMKQGKRRKTGAQKRKEHRAP